MHGISKRFGVTVALESVHLEAAAGEVRALVGENGAGKSTLMKVLSGALRPDAGRMTLGGHTFAPLDPSEARRRGVAMIYQELTLAPHLSVSENMFLGIELHRFGVLHRQRTRRRVREVLELLEHPEILPDEPVRRLSISAQQLVEVGRALVSDARVIIFDEPTSSLTRQDTERLFEVIRRLKARGVAIIYISHFVEEVREISDHFTILRPQDGEMVRDLPDFLDKVTDVDDRDAAGLQAPDHLEETLGILPRQRARGLIEDDHPRVRDESPSDLHELLRADTEPPNRLVGQNLRVFQQLEHLTDSPSRPLTVQDTETMELDSQKHVFGHGEVGSEGQFLIDHRDTPAARLGGIERSEGVPAQGHPAGVGSESPRENLHQGALAGSILADEGANLAGRGLQMHRLQRHRHSEALGNSVHRQRYMAVHDSEWTPLSRTRSRSRSRVFSSGEPGTRGTASPYP